MWRLAKAKAEIKVNTEQRHKVGVVIPVRASKRNSVVLGSNPTQDNFLWLLLKSFSGEYHIYTYIHIHIYNIYIYIYIIYICVCACVCVCVCVCMCKSLITLNFWNFYQNIMEILFRFFILLGVFFRFLLEALCRKYPPILSDEYLIWRFSICFIFCFILLNSGIFPSVTCTT